jgi:hypothetical protein
MTDISKRLEQVIRKELAQTILPIKTDKGILVGDILIKSDGSVKHLYKHDELIYSNIHLNVVAIKMANLLALAANSVVVSKIYTADQEYGKWYVDSQVLRTSYERSVNAKNFDRADMLWARYIESRTKTDSAKNKVQALVNF